MNDVDVVAAVLRQSAGRPRSEEMIARDVIDALRTEAVREIWSTGGGECAVCDQKMKVSRTAISPLLVEALAIAYHDVEADTTMFFHAPSLVHRRASRQVVNFSVLAMFGLVERLELAKAWRNVDVRGVYRITDLGVRWLRGEAAIPRIARVYNQQVLGTAGPQTTVSDVWGSRFDIDGSVVRAPSERSGLVAV
jgi:hypothetical protein